MGNSGKGETLTTRIEVLLIRENKRKEKDVRGWAGQRTGLPTAQLQNMSPVSQDMPLHSHSRSDDQSVPLCNTLKIKWVADTLSR